MSTSTITLLIPLAIVLIAILIAYGMLRRFIATHLIKLEQGHALLISRAGGRDSDIRVSFSGGFVWPAYEKAETMDIRAQVLEIDLRGANACTTKDDIRVESSAGFCIRVNPTPEDVIEVARRVGSEQAADKDTLKKLFVAKFSQALRTAVKSMTFEELCMGQEKLQDAILKAAGKDLCGYNIEDVSVSYLEKASS